MTNNEFIQELLEKADIVDIIGRFVSLQKKGADFWGLCPFHADNNPSFCVSPKKKIWSCWVCPDHGNVITFIQKYKKISFGQAVKEVALLAGYSQEDINAYFSKQNKNYSDANFKFISLNSDANDLFKQLLFDPDNKQYLEYLHNRKLSDETIKLFDLGFCGKNNEHQIAYDLLANKEVNPNAKWNEDDLLKSSLININNKTYKVTDYFFNRITFPIKDRNGFIVAFIGRDITKDSDLKYLTSRETVLFDKSKTLYNIDKVFTDKTDTLVVLEGNVDLMSLYEAGMDLNKYSAVALMGTALTENHIRMIQQSGFIKNIILWFDNDNAGAHSTITSGLHFLKTGFNIMVVNNNTSHKDVNDILVKEGKQKVLDILTDPNKPDFISYYISKKLVDLNSTNLISKVEDVLALIHRYGNVLLWNKYVTLISKLTNLSVDDITTAYGKIQKNAFSPNKYSWQAQPKTDKKVISPDYKNLINALNVLMRSLIYQPTLAEIVWNTLEHKVCNNEMINDFIYVVKALSIADIDPNNYLGSVEKVLNNLYETHKVGQKSYLALLKMVDEQKETLSLNMNQKVSPSTVKIQVQHVDYYFNLLEKQQILDALVKEGISEVERENLTNKLAVRRNKINEFKRRKASRFSK